MRILLARLLVLALLDVLRFYCCYCCSRAAVLRPQAQLVLSLLSSSSSSSSLLGVSLLLFPPILLIHLPFPLFHLCFSFHFRHYNIPQFVPPQAILLSLLTISIHKFLVASSQCKRLFPESLCPQHIFFHSAYKNFAVRVLARTFKKPTRISNSISKVRKKCSALQ